MHHNSAHGAVAVNRFPACIATSERRAGFFAAREGWRRAFLSTAVGAGYTFQRRQGQGNVTPRPLHCRSVWIYFVAGPLQAKHARHDADGVTKHSARAPRSHQAVRAKSIAQSHGPSTPTTLLLTKVTTGRCGRTEQGPHRPDLAARDKYTILYYTILYYTILYYTILIILYYTRGLGEVRLAGGEAAGRSRPPSPRPSPGPGRGCCGGGGRGAGRSGSLADGSGAWRDGERTLTMTVPTLMPLP